MAYMTNGDALAIILDAAEFYGTTGLVETLDAIQRDTLAGLVNLKRSKLVLDDVMRAYDIVDRDLLTFLVIY